MPPHGLADSIHSASDRGVQIVGGLFDRDLAAGAELHDETTLFVDAPLRAIQVSEAAGYVLNPSRAS